MKISHLLIAVLLTLFAGNSYANLISNGSFESGLAGWSCTHVGGGCFAGSELSYWAAEGTSYFYGYSNAGTGHLAQGFTSVAGATYSISLFFNTNDQTAANTLSLDVGNLGTGFLLVNDVWSPYTSNFIANSAFTTIDFSFSTVGGSGTVWVDNVIVELVQAPNPVPVPAPFVLIALGLAGIGLSRRKKA